jgi:hypothetical protein
MVFYKWKQKTQKDKQSTLRDVQKRRNHQKYQFPPRSEVDRDQEKQ